ncbi:unnamed protein product [Ectocarpus sp. 6 AP-2014]
MGWGVYSGIGDDEKGADECLPTLRTHSLDGVVVPDSVLKEWRRRKGLGAPAEQTVQQSTVAKGGGAEVAIGGRFSSPASPRPGATLSRCLRRIKKMAPLDERGMWLLNNLLSQTRVEDQEELCWSVQDKLSKRKGALIRSKDRLKLECDRRCVFTRATNEVRTTSAMTAQVNRCNILATVVKEHQNARRSNDQSRRHRQPPDNTNSAANTAPLAPPSTTADRRKDKGALRGKEVAKEKEVAREITSSNEKEGSNDRRVSKAEGRGSPPEYPSSILLSINMAKMRSSGEIVAAGGDATLPRRAGRKRPNRTRNAPFARHGGLLQVAASEECVVPPASSSLHGRDVPALAEGAPVAVGRTKGGRYQKKKPMGRVGRLGLPSISERYGASVMENWVQSPVALKLERPRCKSVAIAHLDQPAYRKYMEAVIRVRAAQTRRRWQQSTRDDTDGVGHGVTGCSKGTTNDCGIILTNQQEGKTTLGCSCHLCDVEPRGFNSQSPPKISLPTSCSNLGGGGKGMFGRTSCEIEKRLRHGEDDEREEFSRARLRTPTKTTSRAPGHGSDISKIATADEILTSEGLGLRSKGARKVFKQTQRLLEALRTPSESCQYDPETGARRNCGGGNIGGHSSVVVHYHQSHSGSGPATEGDRLHRGGGGDPGGDAKVTDPKFSDIGMWRAPRGNRSARLKEVLDCVAPPHTVRIECEIILHESLSRAGDRREGNGGTSGGGSGTWDDFVFAWECLGDGILAGRALSGHWEHAHQDGSDHNPTNGRLQRAADDLLSDGLMRALLSTRCYRPPGRDQLFVEWLDELLEVVRTHVRRACLRVPVQHGLTAGLEWFQEWKVDYHQIQG